MCSFRVREPAEQRPGNARAGFTLIEVLVAMVIGGLLTGVIFQLMQGQASFVDLQSARQEVQQNARGTLELISGELRAAPPGAIINASANRIEMRVPRVWGVTCNETGELKKSVWVLVPQGTFPTDFPTNPSSAPNWGLAVPAADGSGSWRWVGITALASGTPACAADVDLSTLGNYQAFQITYNPSLGTTRAGGMEVFIWQSAVYETGTGASSSRLWVKRNNGASTPQVMAGPLTESDGLVFSYWCGNNNVSPPGSNTSGFPNLTAVQVKVSMASTRGTAAGPQVETDSVRIALRNSRGGTSC